MIFENIVEIIDLEIVKKVMVFYDVLEDLDDL